MIGYEFQRLTALMGRDRVVAKVSDAIALVEECVTSLEEKADRAATLGTATAVSSMPELLRMFNQSQFGRRRVDARLSAELAAAYAGTPRRTLGRLRQKLAQLKFLLEELQA